jgi:predicted aminopeptidase
VATLGGCSSLRYAAHVARGEAGLLAQRKSIERVIADPRTDARTRTRLREAQAARAFASDHLALPRNRSYTQFVALDRPYVSWSVFATPEFSVDPIVHCFPFAGCVAYRGWFDRALAERDAAQLAKRGDDVSIEGVAAFSTLGWFADPIVSSMLRGDADSLDGVIFHELAHQQFYLAGDTAFNESYASFVEREGLREWRFVARRSRTRHARRRTRRAVRATRPRPSRTPARVVRVDARRRSAPRGKSSRIRRVPCALRDVARRRMAWRSPLRRMGRASARQRASGALRLVRHVGASVRGVVRAGRQGLAALPRARARTGRTPEAERARRLAALSAQKASH